MSKKLHFSITVWSLALVATLFLLQACMSWWNIPLAYHRSSIAGGEWWRLVSGHLVHLGWVHTALNTLTLFLIIECFSRYLHVTRTLILLIVLSLLTSVGLWYLSPGVGLYVGLSGVLHGLFANAVINSREYPLWIRIVLFIALVSKLIWEASPAYDESMLRGWIGGAVIEQAHLYGAVAGTLVALLQNVFRKLKPV